MTIPGIDAPLRSVARSKSARVAGLALLLIVDILIILWMGSGRPSGINFTSPLRSPLSTPQDAKAAEHQAGQREASSSSSAGTSSADTKKAASTTVVTSDAPADTAPLDGGARLLEVLGASAAPRFTRGATPVQPRDRTRTRAPGGTVVAIGGGSALRPGMPNVPGGVIPIVPPTVVDPDESALLPLPGSPGAAPPPPASGPGPDPTDPPARTTDPPASTTDPPARAPDPPAEPTSPPADSTDPPADSTDPPADSTDPLAEPDATPELTDSTATPKPKPTRCTTPPCGRR